MLAAIAVVGLAGCASGPKIPPSVGPQIADVPQWLVVYAQLTGKTVEFAEEPEDNQTPIRLENRKSVTRAQACKLIEHVLRDQAGLVVLRRYRDRVVFGDSTARGSAAGNPTTIETELADSKEDPIAHLVTLLLPPGGLLNEEASQASVTFFQLEPEHLSPDQILNLAFEDKALLSLRHVKRWEIVEEKKVQHLSYPEDVTAAVVRTNVGEYVVLLDNRNYQGTNWMAIFYKIEP
jgi:hypothetical protein